MWLHYLSSIYSCHIVAGASNALTASTDVAPVDAHDEAKETEDITKVMTNDLLDDDSTAEYYRPPLGGRRWGRDPKVMPSRGQQTELREERV